MKKRLLVCGYSTFLAMTVASLHPIMAMDQSGRPTLKWALDNPDEITPDVLKDPANSALLAELKQQALTSHRKDAVVPLLRMGDHDVLHDTVSLYHKRIIRYYSEDALAESKTPDLIPLIGEDLNRNESATHGELRGDIMLSPLSVRTAEIIKDTILNSPAFSSSVRDWAKGLPVTGNGLRQPMKVWWNQNKALLKAKRYSEVEPPR
jgi:hypothetical protein